MGLFDKLKKSPEQEAKYQARLAEIKAKREGRLSNVHTKQAENHANQVKNRGEIQTEYKERLDIIHAERDERLSTIRAERVQNQVNRAEHNQIIQPNQQKSPSKYQIERDERKATKAALANTRGKELGYVAVSYIGGYDGQRRFNAKLRFYENQVEYSSMGKPVKDLVIPASEVASIEVGGQQQTNSRISVTRMATLGVFSLAAPKRTKIKDTSVTIGLKDGRQVFFHTKMYTEFEVHTKLANAISYYHQLQVKQDNQQATVNTTGTTDNAAEIMKYATLLKRGVITQEEYQAKKRQLLGL